jgi:hypothetical protein
MTGKAQLYALRTRFTKAAAALERYDTLSLHPAVAWRFAVDGRTRALTLRGRW